VSKTNNTRQVDTRRSFLLTYSQADLTKYSDCKAFSELVLEAMKSVKSTRQIKEWACCQEKHSDGGTHYRMSVNLSGTRRWQPIKNHVYKNTGVSVNFATKNCGYVAAYRYVCKDKAKEEVLHSEGHTSLEAIHTPKTNKAMCRFSNSRSEKRKSLSFEGSQGASSSSAKRTRLSKQNVAEFLIKNNIKSDDELLLAANKRKAAGEPDLHNIVINSNSKALSELVSLTWRIENAPKVVERQKKSALMS